MRLYPKQDNNDDNDDGGDDDDDEGSTQAKWHSVVWRVLRGMFRYMDPPHSEWGKNVNKWARNTPLWKWFCRGLIGAVQSGGSYLPCTLISNSRQPSIPPTNGTHNIHIASHLFSFSSGGLIFSIRWVGLCRNWKGSARVRENPYMFVCAAQHVYQYQPHKNAPTVVPIGCYINLNLNKCKFHGSWSGIIDLLLNVVSHLARGDDGLFTEGHTCVAGWDLPFKDVRVSSCDSLFALWF